MTKEKQIEEMVRNIGEKQKGGWKFVGESEHTTDTSNEELAEHLVINKGYRRASDVAREIFEEIEREIKNHGICYTQRKIAELKKKYTEGEKNEQRKAD